MSKRYKLIKDLPTFSAGQEFYIGKEDALWLDTGTGRDICAYAAQTLQKFPNILKDWFEEIPEKPKTVDDLKEGDTWFFINYSTNQNYISETTNFICIEAFKQVGNAFLTREEAEKELARREAKVILERDAKGFKATKGGHYYEVAYSCVSGELLEVYFNGAYLYEGIKFATREDAQESIRKHPEEWKTYLGVEE